ncbi:MAG: HAD-IA family hydrolase [Gorillibacterium sp.]|nr:HAD-IA family hydrolase [Gorillibacterium sp.]
MDDLKKPLLAYKAVFFDAGDTLITVPNDRMIFNNFLNKRLFYRQEEQVGQLVQEAIRLFYADKRMSAESLCSAESDKRFWMEIYTYILHRLGAEEQWDAEEIADCSLALYNEFLNPAHYALFSDVVENLERIRSLGLRMGIISNFSPGLRNILQDKAILSLFDPVIISTEVGLEKPNPDIFTLALGQSGLEAADVLYVGDHEWNDVWAPNQVGVDAIRIKRYDYHTGEGITSLAELI